MPPAPDPSGASQLEAILCSVADAIATVTLNRPEAPNTIVPPRPEEAEAAVGSPTPR